MINFEDDDEPFTAMSRETERKRISRPLSRKNGAMKKKNQRKRMIAWDSEGINLSGSNLPQHMVLLGSSADIQNPLVINGPEEDLSFEQIAEYMLECAVKHPDCWHVGYFFKYDQNMIIKSLHWALKQRLYENGRTRIKSVDGKTVYYVEYIPGKSLRITRRSPNHATILIEDIGTFFATSFIKAYQQLFPELIGTPDYKVIEEGKKMRGANGYNDLPQVIYYWKAEINALEQLATRFRDYMWDNGQELTRWAGPGAFANYIRKKYKLDEHEWGVKEENIPPELHRYAKKAFTGGRFEQFHLGRIEGPVYAPDINSAYPAAYCNIPSFRKGGHWTRVTEPSSPNVFGVYHVKFRAPEARPIRDKTNPIPLYQDSNYTPPVPVYRAMPFAFRTAISTVKFPTAVDSCYFTPEIYSARNAFGDDAIEIIDGWEWIPVDAAERPWKDIIEYYYKMRMKLKAEGNPAQMVFKLGPNCLYGKNAQRVGWKMLGKAPKSHALLIAGYVTSFTRALIYDVVQQIPEEHLIAIETDAIYTTYDINKIVFSTGIGKGLGQWGVDDAYDEMYYIQNGFYFFKKDGKWGPPKSRGFSPDNLSPAEMKNYLMSLSPTADKWEPFHLGSGQRFTTLGASLARSKNGKEIIDPVKASMLHCAWFEDERYISPGEKGKRVHRSVECNSCQDGNTAYDAPHPLRINMSMMIGQKIEEEYPGYPVSHPHNLPWEEDYKEPVWIEYEEALGLDADYQSAMEAL